MKRRNTVWKNGANETIARCLWLGSALGQGKALTIKEICKSLGCGKRTAQRYAEEAERVLNAVWDRAYWNTGGDGRVRLPYLQRKS